MTTATKYLTGTYSAGYSLQGTITTLHVASTAVVNGKQTGSAVYTTYGTTRSGALAILNYGLLQGGRNEESFGGLPAYFGAPTSGIYIHSSASVSITNGSAAAASAYIFGYGAGIEVFSPATSITNFATISAATGPPTRTRRYLDDAAVMLQNGGTVVNGAVSDHQALLMGGYRGVVINGAAGTVTNFATIEMTDRVGETSYPGSIGVDFSDGGSVANGSTADLAAVIRGGVGVYISGAGGTVSNFGTVLGQTVIAELSTEKNPGAGIVLLNGGKVINGSTSAPDALISGAVAGVVSGSASVYNYAQIVGSAAYGNGAGIRATTGKVVNGGAKDHQARIEGYRGVVTSAADSVANFGAIIGQHIGVDMEAGGVLTNGIGGVITGENGVFDAANGAINNAGAIDSFAGAGVELSAGGTIDNTSSGVIDGFDGVSCAGPATVDNDGQILTGGGSGVSLSNGGALINGLVIGEKAVIRGADVYGSEPEVVANSYASVTNLSEIDGYGGVAVALHSGSTLSNGSKYDNFAEIQGVDGVYLSKGSTVTNFGTILGSRESGYGVSAADHSRIVNVKGALISAFAGVKLANHATLFDYGRVTGSGGTAIYVGTTDDLFIWAGASFSGSVSGGGGELSLGAGPAILRLPSNGAAVVSGLVATTTFSNFGAVDISQPSTSALGGAADAVGGVALSIEGALAAPGALSLLANSANPNDGGQLSLTGTLSGAGSLNIGAGAVANFLAGASLTIGHVNLSSAASHAEVNDANLTYAGVWTQKAGTLTVGSGDAVTFTGVGDLFRGTLAGAGHVFLAGGSDTLSYLAVDTFLTISGPGTVTAAGSITMAGGEISSQGGTLVVGVGSGGASFSGGTVALGDSSVVIGSSATSTLYNVSTMISGAGKLGDGRMRLVNGPHGAIAAQSSTAALVINTGTVVMINQGTIASYAAGGLIIESALSNTGLLFADGGDITAQKGVSGAGSVEINSATAAFASTLTENVDFVTAFYMPPASGTLQLAKSQTYIGTISGFTTTGTTALDLQDIRFASGTTKATYSGTTTGGVLTVTDGTHTAHIKFSGDYTGSTFTLSKDAGTGTIVVDPTKPAAAHLSGDGPLQHFVAAMASFGDERGAVMSLAGASSWWAQSLIASPAAHRA